MFHGNDAAGKIAIDFPNTLDKLHAASLFYLALILLVIGVITSLIAQVIASRSTQRDGDQVSAIVDPTAPLRPPATCAAVFVNHLVSGASILASFIAVAVLALVTYDVAKQGASALSWSFITKNP